MNEFSLGALNENTSHSNAFTPESTHHTLRFTLDSDRAATLSPTDFEGNLAFVLRDRNGNRLHDGTLTAGEAIAFPHLLAGDYDIELTATGGIEAYGLEIETRSPTLGETFSNGVFTVGDSGEIEVGYLGDGGSFEGQVGFFSLNGLANLEPGSEDWIAEVTRRVASNSTLGYTVIDDRTERAELEAELPWEANFNAGEARGDRTYHFAPGDRFGVLLVPNGEVNDVVRNPGIGGDRRPLFSLVTANPNEAFHLGQVTDVTGEGSTFTFEDRRVDTGSDRDYNDVVFRVKGAVGEAPLLAAYIDRDRDWRPTKFGDDLRAYLATETESPDPDPNPDPNPDPTPGTNGAPRNLRFSNLPLYTTAETLSFVGGRVEDPDGDLQRVEVWIEDAGGRRIEVDDIVDFRTEEGSDVARFDFQYDLENLAPGRYQLQMQAFDGEDRSEPVSRSFSVLTDSGEGEPDGLAGLSDPVRFAIADAANLDAYTPEALEAAKEWVVFLKPGVSADGFAAAIGAQNLGETGFIDNTYLWQFEDTKSFDDIQTDLNSLQSVELAYPDVPVPLRLLHAPEDRYFQASLPDNFLGPLWHLKQNVDPSQPSSIEKAWDILGANGRPIRGSGATIAIVDDGVDFNHPDLVNAGDGSGFADPVTDERDRYLGHLSFDFNDGDDSPLPLSLRKISREPEAGEGFVPYDFFDHFSQKRFAVEVPVNLTGFVSDFGDADLSELLGAGASAVKPYEDIVLELDINENLDPDFLRRLQYTIHSPELADMPLDWYISPRYQSWPGWQNFRPQFSTNPKRLQFDEDGKIFQSFDSFNGDYIGGFWRVEFSLTRGSRFTPEEIQDLGSQLVEGLSLTLQARNPHGTAVAGVVVAGDHTEFYTDFNRLFENEDPTADTFLADSLGSVGVAPEANFAALRLIGSVDPFTSSDEVAGSTIANALFDTGSTDRNREIDIFNNSWGTAYLARPGLALTALEKGAEVGREGDGNIYIFSAGNEGGANLNFNALANARQTIAVGAIGQDDRRTSYSTPGDALLVTAYSSDEEGGPAIFSTAFPSLDPTSHLPVHDDFGGTSASAPFVSGVVALMLDANPDLTARDVQHILVETAYQVDPGHRDWDTNRAGYTFNPHYGFGAVNPVDAVEFALDWQPVAAEAQAFGGGVASTLNYVGDDIDSDGVASTFYVDKDITIEHVEVSVDIDHGDWGDLRIELIAPEGRGTNQETVSVLAWNIHEELAPLNISIEELQNGGESEHEPVIPTSPYRLDSSQPGAAWTFTSVRHWGESSQGEWELRVYDKDSEDELEGVLNGWTLTLHGTEQEVSIAPISLGLSVSEEGETQEQFEVSRRGTTENDLIVQLDITGDASLGEDYTLFHESDNDGDPTTIRIPAGKDSVTVNLDAIDDDDEEETETVELTLVDAELYAVEEGEEPIDVQILDNDAAVPDTIHVDSFDDNLTNGDDQTTLREAVIAANERGTTNPGETTTIVLGEGDFYLALEGTDEDAAQTGDLDITSNIIIRGAGADRTTIDADFIDRVFHVLESGDLTLEGVTIAGGDTFGGTNPLGGGIANDGNLHVSSTTISDNFAESGGGIYNTGTLEVTDSSTITGNTVDERGGGIDNRGGTVAIADATISNNQATFNSRGIGGGINSVGGSLTVANTTIADNTAGFVGGGIANDGGSLTVTNATTISGNTARNGEGGGIYNKDAAIAVTDSTFANNTADASGGALANRNESNGSNIDDTLANNSISEGSDGSNDIANTSGSGSDTIVGGADDDYISGGAGEDSLDGSDGNDTVSFQNDEYGVIFSLSEGVATFVDSAGNEVFTETAINFENADGTPFDDSLTGNGDRNILRGFGGDDTLIGGEANEILEGGRGSDILEGGDGNDFISGEFGDDTLVGGAGEDILAGDSGDDLFLIDEGATNAQGDGADRVSNFTSGSDRVWFSIDLTGGLDYSDLNFSEGEGVTGATGFAEGKGGIAVNTTNGNVYITGYEGGTVPVLQLPLNIDLTNLTLEDFSFFDPVDRTEIAIADTGPDGELIVGTPDSDRLEGGDGNDTILGLGDHDAIVGGLGMDSLDGGDGFDEVSFWKDEYAVVFDFATETATFSTPAGDTVFTETARNFESAVGTNFNDRIIGDGDQNHLRGFGGNDTLIGNDGNDLIYSDRGVDFLDGGDGLGIDTVSFGPGEHAVIFDLTGETATFLAPEGGTAFIETVRNFESAWGSIFNDRLSGDDSANILFGDSGDDTLSGNDGDDSLEGWHGNDLLTGGNGNDSLFGSFGNNLLVGEAGDDTLRGGQGNDTLHGGIGTDSLIGEAGNDLFQITKGATNPQGDGADLITDFAPGDHISLSSVFARLGETNINRYSFVAGPNVTRASVAFFPEIAVNTTTGHVFIDGYQNGTIPILTLSPAGAQAVTRNDFSFFNDTSAPTIRVTSFADNLISGDGLVTLREAIIAANTGGTTDLGETGTTIALPAGTFDLSLAGAFEDVARSGDLDITNDINIRGAGADNTIIDANQIDRVFHVLGSGNLTLEDVTITGGKDPFDGGGILIDPGSVATITDAAISNNTAPSGGGIQNSGTLTVVGSDLSNNSSTGGAGGAIRNSGNLTVSNSSIFDNYALTGGGGIFNSLELIGYPESVALVENSQIFNNTTDNNGGGIANWSNLTVIDSTISGNTASGLRLGIGYGGGIDNAFEGDLTVTGSNISGNTALGSGGGISNTRRAGQLNITNSTIANNTVQSPGGFGGGISSVETLGTTLNVTGNTITENSAVNGSGIFSIGGFNNDTIVSDEGDSYLEGSFGNDSLVGGIGNDTISGGSGTDTLTGGAGNDLFRITEGATDIFGSGADTITDFAPGDHISLSNIFARAGATDINLYDFAFGPNVRQADVGAAPQIAVNTTDGRVFIDGYHNGTIPILTLSPEGAQSIALTDFSFFAPEVSTPIAPGSLIVTHTRDSGLGSLRDALEKANSTPGLDKIAFDLSKIDANFNSLTGAYTIQLETPLPEITDSLEIDGTTQEGFAGNPIVEIDGSAIANSGYGLTFRADNNLVKGLAINDFQGSLHFTSASTQNTLEDNYLGVDITGIQIANASANGVRFDGASSGEISNNIIGDSFTIGTSNGSDFSDNEVHGDLLIGGSNSGNFSDNKVFGELSIGGSNSGTFSENQISEDISTGSINSGDFLSNQISGSLIIGDDNFGDLLQNSIDGVLHIRGSHFGRIETGPGNNQLRFG